MINISLTSSSILKKLRSLANPKDAEGMARFGIKADPGKILGIRVPMLRKIAKEIGKNQKLALELWSSGYHEARLLAGMIAEIERTDDALMEAWVKDFASWDVCDETMLNLFYACPLAHQKAIEWTKREKEFEKRAGFALMAVLAWKDKKATDARFEKFIRPIIRGSADERNFVKKAVNWALRQIGKRNLYLNKKFVQVAEEIAKINSKPARWIAADALRELKSEAVLKRLR